MMIPFVTQVLILLMMASAFLGLLVSESKELGIISFFFAVIVIAIPAWAILEVSSMPYAIIVALLMMASALMGFLMSHRKKFSWLGHFLAIVGEIVISALVLTVINGVSSWLIIILLMIASAFLGFIIREHKLGAVLFPAIVTVIAVAIWAFMTFSGILHLPWF